MQRRPTACGASRRPNPRPPQGTALFRADPYVRLVPGRYPVVVWATAGPRWKGHRRYPAREHRVQDFQGGWCQEGGLPRAGHHGAPHGVQHGQRRHGLVVWNRSQAACDELGRLGPGGGHTGGGLREASTVFLMLADGEVTDLVLQRGTPGFGTSSRDDRGPHGHDTGGVLAPARGRHGRCRWTLRRGTGLRVAACPPRRGSSWGWSPGRPTRSTPWSPSSPRCAPPWSGAGRCRRRRR